MENLKHNLQSENQNFELLMGKIHIPWKKSKDEIWTQLHLKIRGKKPSSGKTVFLNRQFAVAASIVVMLGIGIFISNYSVKKISPTNNVMAISLPDHSSVTLNANSKLSYKPFLWWAGRKIKLSGEAFFEVQKGKSFKVNSKAGEVEVLGTSFNIYARDNNYEVTCFTGKVKVTSAKSKQSLVLLPSEKASLSNNKLQKNYLDHPEKENMWISQKLIFTGANIESVFNKIENLYNIKILYNANKGYKYSGSINPEIQVDALIEIICQPFGLKVEHINNTTYQVTE